jgi:alkylation response protein AidB-like acyl-CoA dehydrogenase
MVGFSEMPFFQTAPVLSNTYETDDLLRSFIERHVPGDARVFIESDLRQMGALSADLHERSVTEVRSEPRIVPFDAWGRRIDRIETTPFWQEMGRIATERGLIATAYERKTGEHSRFHQMALVYLFEPSSHTYSCPLAMTDGAARTLLFSQNSSLVERAIPRLTSRDPKVAWTSGQWMTERTGGSDVGISETVAKKDGNDWRLWGTKWFTSAATGQMTLTLARPEGNPSGGRGLAVFYLETEDNQIRVLRLKDKLGTRMLPTAELELEGTKATPVMGLTDGVKNIAPMLTTTRTWNAIAGVSGARRLLDLARDYAKKRVAFGAPLSEKPLHTDTLADVTAELDAAVLLAFRCVQLIGREETKTITELEAHLLRLIVPLAKLTTGKQAVALSSELVEAFGGAGYVEDTGVPRYMRDAQVLPIWEGTTNVLSLDVLRVLQKGGSLQPLRKELERCIGSAKDPSLGAAGAVAERALDHAEAWIKKAIATSPTAVEAGARRFAMTLGRSIELALLVDHAQWELEHGKTRAAASARRFARTRIDLIVDDLDEADAKALA